MALVLSVCVYFIAKAQNNPSEPSWQYSVRGSVQLGVREKSGEKGSFTARFILTNPSGEHYSAQRFVSQSQFAYVHFPQDFSISSAKPGRYTWLCVVDQKIVAGGHFDYAVMNDYSGEEMPMAELESEKQRFEQELEGEYESGKLDGYLSVKVRATLALEGELREEKIKVEVEKGVVTLSGSVRSAAQKMEAERRTRSIDRVKTVKNQIMIVPKD